MNGGDAEAMVYAAPSAADECVVGRAPALTVAPCVLGLLDGLDAAAHLSLNIWR